MRKCYIRVTLVAVTSLLLSACFQTQLNGSVGGAQVNISALRTPNQVLASQVSMGPAEWIVNRGQEGWDEWSPATRLLVVGTTLFKSELPELEPDTLYLLQASGGEDYDPGHDGVLGDNPSAVQGRWHVIATGQRITEGNLKISALTEALYRQQLPLLDQLSDAQIMDRLNAAATLVVGDADDSGTVDYDDVLRWNRTVDEAFFLGDVTAVDALSDGITAAQPADMLDQLAQAVLGSQQVEMVFDAGTVVVETYNWEAPITVANFLGYVGSGFYDQMLVHRTIENFMIQMGWVSFDGLNESNQITFSLKTPGDSIINESNNGLSNLRGNLAMARTREADSATSQFFINQADNVGLDFGSSRNPDGYAVFARVISGMNVVDSIALEPTTYVPAIGDDVPARGVILESVRLL